jgi:Ca-activated chloride channel family protein
LPDTLHLDPSLTYDMTVHTIPPVSVRNIELTAGKHNIMAAQTPQGHLVIKTAGSYDAGAVQCVIRQAGENSILDVQNMNTKRQYLVGNYDVEILTLPKLEYNNVKVSNGKESEIVIPEPGILQMSSVAPGMVSIMMTVDGRPVKIFESELQDPITVKIQPGDYEVIFRTNTIRSARLTQVKKTKVGPRSSILLQF